MLYFTSSHQVARVQNMHVFPCILTKSINKKEKNPPVCVCQVRVTGAAFKTACQRNRITRRDRNVVLAVYRLFINLTVHGDVWLLLESVHIRSNLTSALPAGHGLFFSSEGD